MSYFMEDEKVLSWFLEICLNNTKLQNFWAKVNFLEENLSF